jgi:DNA repair photolyase
MTDPHQLAPVRYRSLVRVAELLDVETTLVSLSTKTDPLFREALLIQLLEAATDRIVAVEGRLAEVEQIADLEPRVLALEDALEAETEAAEE